ncbi:MAG: hypothetical protein ACD_12C00116G0003 [uncultured bacterium]|nr:MAG: hypothetical protein ACD_12C00116G0003 [uncultured bacterium]
MRNFILALVCLAIIVGVFLSVKKFQSLIQKSDQLKKTANEIPSSATGDVLK